MTYSERAAMGTGPESKVKKILVAGLDENDKPVFSTIIVGTLEMNLETDHYENHSFSGTILSSWDVPTEYEIIVRGRPVEE